MRYPTPLMALLALGYYTSLAASFHMSFQGPDASHDDEMIFRGRNADSDRLLANEMQNEELEQAIDILRKLLILPWPNGESPLLYVENNNVAQQPDNSIFNDHVVEEDEQVNPVPMKRMRYYRKYPWKRQNVRYDPDSRFVCSPTKDEVHRLLVALHESRYGNRNLAVDFCNRKRPAYAVFTNIRYLGK
nr:uncharacterized protein LOC111515237 [Leptinotarsa decemlineata]